ncbi:MAG: hypothetical protein ACO20O_12590, partial [Pseudomonadales bacterium]
MSPVLSYNMQHPRNDRALTCESAKTRSLFRCLIWLSVTLVAPLSSANLITIDGKLDEPAWQSA